MLGAGVGGDELDRIVVLIEQLRRKLEPEPAVPRYLLRIDTEMYVFVPDGGDGNQLEVAAGPAGRVISRAANVVGRPSAQDRRLARTGSEAPGFTAPVGWVGSLLRLPCE